ncbi:MAG: hypothetical protein AB7P08_04730 [Burkholderiales bacterium]
MASRIIKGAGLVIAAPLIIAAVVVSLPFIFLVFIGRFFGHLWYVARLRSSWPSGKFVLFAYTESELWAPYIEGTLLPQIAEHCVVVNRSREDWKRHFPGESGALSFWGGGRSYNPIAVVLRPWGRIRVFRFYESFKKLKQGHTSSLEGAVSELVHCVRDTANVRT